MRTRWGEGKRNSALTACKAAILRRPRCRIAGRVCGGRSGGAAKTPQLRNSARGHRPVAAASEARATRARALRATAAPAQRRRKLSFVFKTPRTEFRGQRRSSL